MEKFPTTTETPTESTRKRKSKKDGTHIDTRPDQATEERKAKRRKKQDDADINAEDTESIRLNEKREKKRLRREAAANSDNRTDIEREEDLKEGKAVDKNDGQKVKSPERVKGQGKKKKSWLKQQVAGGLKPYKDPVTKVEVEQSLAIQSATGSAKKIKRTNKTGFPDPNEDTSLSDQARKALAYAFAQFYRPSKWKFHKARQNWIVRNVLSIESIPEVYFPLAIAYLIKVQGGARENLLTHCRISLELLKVQDPSPETTTSDTSVTPIISTSPTIDLVKLARAKSLIHSLDVNDVTNG